MRGSRTFILAATSLLLLFQAADLRAGEVTAPREAKETSAAHTASEPSTLADGEASVEERCGDCRDEHGAGYDHHLKGGHMVFGLIMIVMMAAMIL